MLGITLLAIGVIGVIIRPRGVPAWAAPCSAAAVGLVAGTLRQPADFVRPLAAPIAFLIFAVPLGALLEQLGFFRAVAGLLGRGEHLVLGLWVFGALVTTVLNLDASVVLLTPLYVQIARRADLDPVALAFQPVLLSCLASSALPVSNLTNLIAASAHHLRAFDFLIHLGPSSVAATTSGWFAYCRTFRLRLPHSTPPSSPDRRALGIGSAVVGAVLLGFVAGPTVHLPEWAVALGADVVLIGVTRHVPVRTIPWGTALVAVSLGLLAGGATAQLQLNSIFGDSSNLAYLRITAVSAIGANLVNNLPALLVALPHAGQGIWALLLGVNIGPLVLVTGTLAALLWQATLAGLGLRVTAREFASVGVRVGGPALVAAFAVLIAMRPLVGS